MVVLLPLFDGERTKTCSCGTVGIGSPIRERSTFYVRRSAKWGDGYRGECRRCGTVQSRERERRRAARDREGQAARRRRWSAAHRERHLEEVRRKDRESRERRRARDPEGWRERQREVQRRYVARRRADVKRDEAARDRDRMAYRGRREREGQMLTVPEVPKTVTSGIRLPIEPFREWIEGLLEEQRQMGEEDPYRRVGALLGVDPRRVRCYVSEFEEVDETIVDRCVCREGRTSLWDLYPEQLDYEPAQMELTA